MKTPKQVPIRKPDKKGGKAKRRQEQFEQERGFPPEDEDLGAVLEEGAESGRRGERRKKQEGHE